MPYDELLRRLARARLVLTDSGGLQEEAPVFGKVVLVLRRATERLEGVELGVARLVGLDPERIVAEATGLLSDAAERRRLGRRARLANPYGDGRAGERIAAILTGERWQPFEPAPVEARALG
jgi:UDP-N-acetylglucosamine 2-epimerase (non-hydrolysing)